MSSLHSPRGQWLWKTTETHTGPVGRQHIATNSKSNGDISITIYLDKTSHSWKWRHQPVACHAHFPSDNFEATRPGMCSSSLFARLETESQTLNTLDSVQPINELRARWVFYSGMRGINRLSLNNTTIRSLIFYKQTFDFPARAQFFFLLLCPIAFIPSVLEYVGLLW